MDDKLLLRRLVENQIRIRHRRHAANGGIIGAGPDVRVLMQQIDEDLDAGLNAAGSLRRLGGYVVEGGSQVGKGRKSVAKLPRLCLAHTART
jgi:hypothetical protein